MKISIITVTYNSAATLKDTIESVKNQNYSNIEHVLVDGGSKDNTVDIIQSYPHLQNWVSEKDKGLYDAINKGINMSTGDVVGILNSDDFFPSNDVVTKIVEAFNANSIDAIYGDIEFVRPGNLTKIIRNYSSKNFETNKFAKGYMPAHPSFYAKKSCYEQFGYYQEDYVIAADYELLIRFLYKYKIKAKYIPTMMVYMRTGGVSNKSIFSRYTLNKEVVRACKENGIYTNMFYLSLKYFNKIFEYIKPFFSKSSSK